jgi:dipeptidyl-peptidase-3
VTREFLERISSVVVAASSLYEQLAEPILAQHPSGLGFPSDVAQSSYYPGNLRMSRKEISVVSKVLEDNSIHPENTRIHKSMLGDKFTYHVLQGSVEVDGQPRKLQEIDSGPIRIARGDHSAELSHICDYLEEARKYAANPLQEKFISECQRSFMTGDIEAFKESQKTWVKDVQPSVETILGFIEPYRDPFGTRAEFEGLVGVVNRDETKMLATLANNSAKFIRRLPWTENSTENDGKGPFEKASFEEPDFTSLHSGFQPAYLMLHLLNSPQPLLIVRV